VSSETAVVVPLAGDLDITTGPRAERQVLEAVATGRAVVLDLAGVTFCDSTGLAIFLRAHNAARRRGTSFTIRNVPPNVGRLLDLTGIAEVLGVTGPGDSEPAPSGQ
jgi:anti-sigma B factor antagonist